MFIYPAIDYCLLFKLQHAAEDVYVYFKQFGEIQSTLHVGRYGKENYVFVEFKCRETAAKIVMRQQFVINGQQFKVASIEPTAPLIYDLYFEFNEMSRAPNVDSPENILNVLDDDCIKLIFDKISNIRDFYSISNVCVRFKKIAGIVFSYIIKHKCVNFRDYLLNNEDLQMVQIENFFCEFGSFVESLEISEHYIEQMEDKSNTLLKIIHKYCKNLRKLDLQVHGVGNQTVAEIQPLLAKLEYLYLDFACGLDFGAFYDFISNCSQLNTLILTGCQSSELLLSMPNVNFPRLIEFKITSKNIAIVEFLELNPQIEKLTLKHSHHMRSFFNHDMPSIQKLSLLNEDECITKEQSIHLKNLRALEMRLEISLDDSIVNIFRLKNVNTLTLHVNALFNENHLISLVENLSNLEQMSIYQNTTYQINFDKIKQMLRFASHLSDLCINWPKNVIQPFDENDYNEILKYVKNRSMHRKLDVYLTNITTLFDDSDGLKKKLEVFERDSEWLRVYNYSEYTLFQN